MSFNFECAICLLNGDCRGASENGVAALTVCGHVFHKNCITLYKQQCQSDLCPLCKRKATRMLSLFGDARQEDEVSEGDDEGDNNVLLESLKDENEHLEARLAAAMDQLTYNERQSDNKDLEILHLSSELTNLNRDMAKLLFKLSLYEDRFGRDVALEMDALMAGN